MADLIANELFRVEAGRAVLFASRRRSTGVVKFPAEKATLFSNDIATDIESIELSTEGTLYTFTTQQFPPPLPFRGRRSPDTFAPYVVGFVELTEGVIVESLIVDAVLSDLHIGQQLISTSTAIETADGATLITFAFKPAQPRKPVERST